MLVFFLSGVPEVAIPKAVESARGVEKVPLAGIEKSGLVL
jgi:hypothetical protein